MALFLRFLQQAWARSIRFRRPLRSVLGLAVAALFALLFVSRADLGQLTATVARVSVPFVLAAAVLYLVNVWLQALRWHFLMKHIGSPGPGPFFLAMAIGIMGNNLLPLQMGYVLRLEYLRSRYHLQATPLFSTMLLEGWMDGLIMAFLFLPVLAIVGTEAWVIKAVLLLGGVAGGGLLLFRFALAGIFRSFWLALLRRLPGGLHQRLGTWVGAFLVGLASLRSGRRMALAGLVTAAAWLVNAGVLYLVGVSLDLDVDWTSYLVVTAAIGVAGAVQISPGNLGSFEFIVTEILVGLGASRGEAAAYAILAHAVLFLPVSLLGLALFAWHRLRGPAPFGLGLRGPQA